MSLHENNYLTEQNGVSVVSCSPCEETNPRGFAANILKSDEKALWMVKGALPQECVLAFSSTSKKPAAFNTVGFYCWHQYDSNPALIELSIKGQTEKWQILSKVRLTLTDGWQYFRVEETLAEKIKLIRVKIMQNFGDSKKTYLNQIALHYVSPSASGAQPSQSLSKRALPSMPREKTHSQFLKLTSTERELKKANQKIDRLTQEQEQMKDKIEAQERVIIKMQETLKRVLASMEKLEAVEEASRYSGSRNTSNNKQSIQKKESQNKKKVEIGEIDEVLNNLQQMDKQYRSGKKGFTGSKKTTVAHLRQRDTIKMNSEDDLSEYSQSHYRTSASHKKHGMSQEAMKEKLKYLLALRNLKTSKLQQPSHHHHSSGEDSSCHSDGCPAHGHGLY